MITLLSIFALTNTIQRQESAVDAVFNEPALVVSSISTGYFQPIDDQQIYSIDKVGSIRKSMHVAKGTVICGADLDSFPIFYDVVTGLLSSSKRSYIRTKSGDGLPVVDGRHSLIVQLPEANNTRMLLAFPLNGTPSLKVTNLGFRDVFAGDSSGNVFIVRAEFQKTRLEKYRFNGQRWVLARSRKLVTSSGVNAMLIAPGSQSLVHFGGRLFCISAPATLSEEEKRVLFIVNKVSKPATDGEIIYRSIWEIDVDKGVLRCVRTFGLWQSSSAIHDSFLIDELGDRHRIGVVGNLGILVCLFDRVLLIKSRRLSLGL